MILFAIGASLFTSHAVQYAGGVLGVNADVTLYEHPPRASITLRGLPIGGTLHGGASYDPDYRVHLDPDLQGKLRRLRVQVEAVAPSHDMQNVYVVVKLPFCLGRHNITLQRK